MTSFSTTLPRLVLCLSLLAIACGDEAEVIDYTSTCQSSARLGIGGQVGPAVFADSYADPFESRAGTDFFDLILQSAEEPHMLVFDFHGLTSAGNFRDALRQRIDSGAENANTLDAVFRDQSDPCDPAQGVVCVGYGTDPNGDGNLFGSTEVIYEASGGTVTFQEVTGNNLRGFFSIQFDPQSSGEAEGGIEGGSLEGCFNVNIDASLTRVF